MHQANYCVSSVSKSQPVCIVASFLSCVGDTIRDVKIQNRKLGTLFIPLVQFSLEGYIRFQLTQFAMFALSCPCKEKFIATYEGSVKELSQITSLTLTCKSICNSVNKFMFTVMLIKFLKIVLRVSMNEFVMNVNVCC